MAAAPITPGWIDLEWMTGWKAFLIFLALAAPIVLLGMRSLAGLGPVRKWVAIGIRLLVLLTLVLIIGGARWQRKHRNVEVIVLRDISDSLTFYNGYPGKSLQDSIDTYLVDATRNNRKPHPDDKVGVISFSSTPLIDAMPNTQLVLDARAIRDKGEGTNIADAIQLALATFQGGSMKRILLQSDGNMNGGDLEAALAAAVAQGVPIDVMPLRYNVHNEIMIEKVSAPSWRREIDAFEVAVSLLSTNPAPVTGKLELLEEGQRVEQPRQITIDAAVVNAQGRLEPRKHVERIKVPPLKARGVRRFKAIFTPDVFNDRKVATGVGETGQPTGASRPGDTIPGNNSGGAFTFVQGKGKILYIDNSPQGSGQTFFDAMTIEGINIERKNIDQFPEDFVALQNYDAIILHNVPLGRTPVGNSGLSLTQDAMIASYVHDFGGGLIMLGGPDSLGAGGWQGSKVEEVMPVNFDIPAQRQMPKGALVLVVHSCEMPNGNYWGEQCAIKAVETLSSQDDIGVIVFDWQGGAGNGINGSSWAHPLQQKGDGQRVFQAIKRMQVGDMPDFDATLQLALHGNGQPGAPSLKSSNAAQKHVIVISDGDPQAPNPKLIQEYLAAKVTISTVSVYPHGGVVPPTMKKMSEDTKGRYYGPIEANPAQLPQIFIKEATVVRRTLIQESKAPPISVTIRDTNSDIMKGVSVSAPIEGLVLSQVKNNPTIEMPMVASLDGKKVDPLFAHWQAGLGKAAVFASDATPIWDGAWWTTQNAGQTAKFFAQMIRGVARPPMSSDFSVTTEKVGDRAKVTVEVTNKDAGYTNFLRFQGKVLDADGEQVDVRMVQTGPGTYEGEFPTMKAGNYVVALQYAGAEGKTGWLASGIAVNESAEMRDLRSNDGLLAEIAKRTKGRLLTPFDAPSANLFTRQDLKVSSSPLPVWDILLPILLGLIILDVAVRRIAWDWLATKRLAAAAADRVRSFTLTRQVEAKPTLDALRRVREEVAETKFKTADAPGGTPATTVQARPDRSAKFEAAKGVEGDITNVVGGATAKPIPSAPKDPKPKGGPAQGHTGSLLEAKRRAQAKIREKEQGE